MITHAINIDMHPTSVPVIIHLSQYDDDYSLVFTLFSSVGEFSLETGTTASIRGTKNDGKGYSVDASIDIDNKKVTVSGNQQMTAVAGKSIFELTLMKNGKELNTANFILDVERAALDRDTIPSESVIKEIYNVTDKMDIIEAVGENLTDINTLADNIDEIGSINDHMAEILLADDHALEAEGYALGKQNGDDVSSTSPYYHNNSKYYADVARINYGSPLKAATASEMTERNRVYVYVGSESGYINGNWYYWNGTAWTDGGAYNATSVNTDTTLTMPGEPADAKVVGDAVRTIPTKTSDITNDGDGTSQFATQQYVDTNGGKIDTISVNGTQQTITNKNVDISVPVIDDTLTETGQAADAKATGDAIAQSGKVNTVNNIQPDGNKNVQTVVELTQAEYDALVTKDPKIVYYITDGSVDYPTASTIPYDHTDSGLTADNVQDAIDEVQGGIGNTFMGTTATTLTGAIAEHESDISTLNSKTDNVTYGTITWNTANVTGDNNRRYYWKLGRLVIVSCEFTPISGKIATGNVIASGLPRPIRDFDRYFVSGGNSQQVCIGNDGTLQWYFPLDTATLRRIDLQMVYFAAE